MPFLQKKASLSMTKHAHKPARAARLQAIVPAILSKTGSDCNSVSLVGALHLLIKTVGLWTTSRSIATRLAMTGLLVGELLALRWQDVDFEKGFFSALKQSMKVISTFPRASGANGLSLSARSVQKFHVSAQTWGESLGADFSVRNGSPLSRRNLLNRQLRPTAKALGMPEANSHWFRHAHATLLDSVGTPLGTVQALLGHSSPEVTRGFTSGQFPRTRARRLRTLQSLLDLNGPKFRFGRK